jgi:hypothetical protein
MRSVALAQRHCVYHEQSAQSQYDPDDLDRDACGVVADEQAAWAPTFLRGSDLELDATVLNDVSGTLSRDSVLGCRSSPL